MRDLPAAKQKALTMTTKFTVVERNASALEKNKIHKKCKYGFPFALRDTEGIPADGFRTEYVRCHAEDIHVTPYNLPLGLFWGGHVNDQIVDSETYKLYLTKYIAR